MLYNTLEFVNTNIKEQNVYNMIIKTKYVTGIVQRIANNGQ